MVSQPRTGDFAGFVSLIQRQRTHLITSRILTVPIALVSLIDENRQWFKARQGIDIIETYLGCLSVHIA